ncbi:YfbM family protein [Streptomyces sp. 184]|uniref:YfbM family protein n=1 Tax=Streptomyces sp. 184 TaxID=1827526 RepID=UPI003892BBDE
MSMIGEYVRVTPAELDRAVREPDWAKTFVFGLLEVEPDDETDDEPDPGEARFLDTDKAWGAIEYLLRRIDFPVNVVHGEESLPGAEEWGYGPPRYLTPEQVRKAAEGLVTTGFGRLAQGVTPDDLARADVYPQIIWKRAESFDYVQGHYEALVEFFEAAAREGDALLVWLG